MSLGCAEVQDKGVAVRNQFQALDEPKEDLMCPDQASEESSGVQGPSMSCGKEAKREGNVLNPVSGVAFSVAKTNPKAAAGPGNVHAERTEEEACIGGLPVTENIENDVMSNCNGCCTHDGGIEEGYTTVSRKTRRFANAPRRTVIVGRTPWADTDFDSWTPTVQNHIADIESRMKSKDFPPPPAYTPPAPPQIRRSDPSIERADQSIYLEIEAQWCECGLEMICKSGTPTILRM